MCIALLRKVNKIVFPVLPRRMGEAVPSGPLFMGDGRGLRLALKRPLPDTSLPSALPRGTPCLLWRGCRVTLHLFSSELSLSTWAWGGFFGTTWGSGKQIGGRTHRLWRHERHHYTAFKCRLFSDGMWTELGPGEPHSQEARFWLSAPPGWEEGWPEAKDKVRFLRTDVTLQWY